MNANNSKKKPEQSDDNKKIQTTIWVCIAILSLILLIYMLYNYCSMNMMNDDEDYDLITCISDGKNSIPLPFFIRAVDKYSPDFIGVSGVLSNLKQTETIGRPVHSIQNTYTSDLPTNDIPGRNNRDHFSSKYSEAWHYGLNLTHYIATNREKFMPISDVEYYLLPKNMMMYIVKMLRLYDNKEFYQVYIYKNYESQSGDNVYRAIYTCIDFLKTKYPGDYIISGLMTAHGHEEVFKDLLPDHWVCDFKTVPTAYDHYLIGDTGIVVSKNLYRRIEYTTESLCAESYQRYLTIGKLYMYTKKPEGVFLADDWKLRRFIDYIVTLPNANLYYYGKPSKYDHEKHNTDGEFDYDTDSQFVAKKIEVSSSTIEGATIYTS